MAVTIESVPLVKLHAILSGPSWSNGPLYFVGDIGGTNARLGLGRHTSDASGTSVSIVFVHFAMSQRNVNQLHEFCDAILAAIKGTTCAQRIASGALSVPGPVTGGGNVAGPFNNLEGILDLREYSHTLFPRGRSALLNDLQAGGFGVLAISDAGVFEQYFTIMWKGTQLSVDAKGRQSATPETALGHGACFVVAPGTGLGTSLVVPVGGSGNKGNGKAKQRFDVLPTEFGSSTIPFRSGTGEYMMALCNFIHGDGVMKQLNETAPLVPIAEDCCCGGSIVFNYLIEKQKLENPGAPIVYPTSFRNAGIKPGDVAKLATVKRDPAAVRALTTSYQQLMWTCSEAVMTFLPETVVIIGDNIVRNGSLFEDHAFLQDIRAAAYAHPMQLRGKFIERSTFLRQVKPINLNLLGCFGFGTRVSTPDVKL